MLEFADIYISCDGCGDSLWLANISSLSVENEKLVLAPVKLMNSKIEENGWERERQYHYCPDCQNLTDAEPADQS